jgi:hypothetical protein
VLFRSRLATEIEPYLALEAYRSITTDMEIMTIIQVI